MGMAGCLGDAGMGQGVLVFGAQQTLSCLRVAARSPSSLLLILVIGDLGGTDALGLPTVTPLVLVTMAPMHLSVAPAFSRQPVVPGPAETS